MQMQILKPHRDGKCYPDYNLMIANAYEEDERNYLLEVKRQHEEWEQKGVGFDGFPFGIVYTSRQACGHYELFQHPIYREYGKEPTEKNIRDSIKDVLDTIEHSKARKCTSCICGWR